MWTNIITASRNLAQQFWIHIPTDRAGLKGPNTTVVQNIIEKKTMINLVLLFHHYGITCSNISPDPCIRRFSKGTSYSPLDLIVRSHTIEQHFLRDEKGVYYEDLYPLISFLPRYADGQTGGPNDQKLPLWDDDSSRAVDMPSTELGRDGAESSDTLRKRDVDLEKAGRDGAEPNDTLRKRDVDLEKAESKLPSEPQLKPARMPPVPKVSDYIPLFRFFRWVTRTVSRRARAKQLASGIKPKRRIYEDVVESYIPLEIILFLSK